MPNDNPPSVSQRFAGKGVFPYQLAFTLLIPLRKLFLSPKTLIERMDLREDHHVLEIGPGPGFFSIPVAQALPRGRLYLFDIQPQMLAHARRRLEKRGLTNIEYHLAGGSEFPFKDGTFDRIVLVTVLGEVEKRDLYAKEIARVLKPGGLVSVSELIGDPDRLSDEELTEIFIAAGLKRGQAYRTRWGDTLNFVRT